MKRVSTNLMVRFPTEVHSQLKAEAIRRGCSQNTLIVQALEAYFTRTDAESMDVDRWALLEALDRHYEERRIRNL